MKAIILAAGRGSRMGELTSKLPKCMTVLFNKQLIEWQFLSLNHKAISEIGIVTGYLKNKFKYKKRYFVNNNWENSNMVSSLLTAIDWLRNDIAPSLNVGFSFTFLATFFASNAVSASPVLNPGASVLGVP